MHPFADVVSKAGGCARQPDGRQQLHRLSPLTHVVFFLATARGRCVRLNAPSGPTERAVRAQGHPRAICDAPAGGCFSAPHQQRSK
jgi:hypothetical protein